MQTPEGPWATPTIRGQIAAFSLPIILLIPFVNRAFNIDEPMFVWVAQQIVKDPLDFFGGAVDVGGNPLPMYLYNQNPPGFSYLLAVGGLIAGWTEPVLHVISMLAAAVFGLGTYLLACRLCRWPLFAATLAMLTPGFFVSATSVMTDVTMAACYVWAAVFWLRWIDTGLRGELAIASAYIAMGALMKYYAISAVPLFAVHAILMKRRPASWLPALLAPGAVLGAFFTYSYWKYGVNLLEAAANTAQHPSIREGKPFLSRPALAVVFMGGCFLPIALGALRAFRPVRVVAWCLASVGLASPLIGGYSAIELAIGTTDHQDFALRIHVAVMFAAGGLLFALTLRGLLRRIHPDSVFLALWVIGALVFTIYVNHLINARVLLPVAPALAILLARSLPDTTGRVWRAVPVAFGAVLSIWVAIGDYIVAETGRFAAQEAAARASKDEAPLYYSGLWGFQYYLMQQGALPFGIEGRGLGEEHVIKMPTNGLLAVSSDGREKWRRAPERFQAVTMFSVANPVYVVTYHPVADAGFYAHLSGVVPYRFGELPREEYGLYRWIGPSYVPEPASP